MSWSEEEVRNNTYWSGRLLTDQRRRLADADADAEASGRRTTRQCVPCFYLRRGEIVGHAFTEFTCRACGEVHRHHNTGVPKLCDGCADARGLCVKCGGLREAPPPASPAIVPRRPRKPPKPSAPKVRRKAAVA